MNISRQLLLFLALFVINSYGQNNNEVTIPDIIPKSPEVKGFERYGEYPVSEYTGIPSINIPLHSIRLKDIEFPISLDYHAAGIQVTQEATWVGLGWNLMAGGCISTVAAGGSDDPIYSLAQPADWTKILNYNPSSMGGYPRRFKEEGERLWGGPCYTLEDPTKSRTPDNILYDGLKGAGERDIYQISFLGYSFKVSIHPVTQQIVFNGEKNKFYIQKNGSTSWLIKDEQGYMYLFSSTESYSTDNNMSTSTWYLTKIISPSNTEILQINYTKKAVRYLPNLSDHVTYKTENVSNYSHLLNTLADCRHFSYFNNYEQLYLSSIISPLDSIVFTTTTRTDLRNALALDEMSIYERSTKSEIKHYKFEHDYFTGVSTGAGTATADYVTKRLRLTGIKEMKGSQIKDTYQFAYNDIQLPYKTSFSQDLWGYYNGMVNNTKENFEPLGTGDESLYPVTKTLLPNPFFISLNQEVAKCLEDIQGANRAANPAYVTAGMLKSITYPTGGKTEFEFESHTFNNRTYPDAVTAQNAIKNTTRHVINNGNSAFSTTSIMFDNETEVPAKIKGTIIGNDYTASQMGEFYVTLKLANQPTIKYAIDTDAKKPAIQRIKNSPHLISLFFNRVMFIPPAFKKTSND